MFGDVVFDDKLIRENGKDSRSTGDTRYYLYVGLFVVAGGLMFYLMDKK